MTHVEIINMISLGFCTWVAIVIALILFAYYRNTLDPDLEDEDVGDWEDDDYDDDEEQRVFEDHWQNVVL